MVLWCDDKYEARWKEMEKTCRNIPIKAMVGDRKLAITHQEDLNPIVSHSLSIWYDVVKQLNLSSQIKKLRWVSYDTDFRANLIDSGFKFWICGGITAYCTLMEKNILQSFQMLKEKYRLEKGDFF